MPTLLVVDDEPAVCYSFRRVFARRGVEVITAETAAAALKAARERHPDVIVLDLQLPDRTGLEVFTDLRAFDPKRPVIFLTAHGTSETAIEAMKGGAFDYLTKPVDVDKVAAVVERALEAARLMYAPAALAPEELGDRIIGRSPGVQEMCKAIGRIAPQDVNVLIRGESGVGKELVARAVYQHSRRADKPFLAINCAAIPESLLESELFGHERGAFTGADRRRIGKFEQTHGGTLFLDEIGDMSPAVQAKMLRVLQDQQFERLGGDAVLRTDVRVVAATNQDLEAMVADGRFRKDLYYRLASVMVTVPPLRERREDIPELAHHFLYAFARQSGRDVRAFAAEALDLLQRHDWPGNVRELQGAVRQAVLRATGHLIRPEDLPPAVSGPVPPPSVAEASELTALIEGLLAKGEPGVYEAVLRQVERVLLPRVLKHTHGHQTQAAELLGLNRATLRGKLRDLGLSLDKVVTEGQPDE